VAARPVERRQGERRDLAGLPARLSQPQAAGTAPRADAMPRLCLHNLRAVLFVQCVNPTLFSEPSRPSPSKVLLFFGNFVPLARRRDPMKEGQGWRWRWGKSSNRL
jgi:hypothetical protein